mmetsp:Transcript_9637/g.16712  ORF Transcript_9637/g.16712 Transcript_9637/m.16712 type:complete len:564 (-) Transcript_9637:99-1790(-)
MKESATAKHFKVGIPGHCNLKKLEETVKAALAARQCSVSAASFSEGSLILRYGEAVTVGAARRWADRVVTPIAYDWKVPIALGDAKCVKLWWRRQDLLLAKENKKRRKTAASSATTEQQKAPEDAPKRRKTRRTGALEVPKEEEKASIQISPAECNLEDRNSGGREGQRGKKKDSKQADQTTMAGSLEAKTVHFVLKGIYFRQIQQGKKDWEFRKNEPYWQKRLEKASYVTFSNGYSKDRLGPFRILEVKAVSLKEAQGSLGCPSGDDCASLFSRETGDLLAVHFEAKRSGNSKTPLPKSLAKSDVQELPLVTWRTGGGSEDMLLTKLREFGYAVVRGLCPLSLVQGAARCVVDRAVHALQLKGVRPGENMEGMLRATWTTSKDMAGWHLSRNLPFGNATHLLGWRASTGTGALFQGLWSDSLPLATLCRQASPIASAFYTTAKLAHYPGVPPLKPPGSGIGALAVDSACDLRIRVSLSDSSFWVCPGSHLDESLRQAAASPQLKTGIYNLSVSETKRHPAVHHELSKGDVLVLAGCAWCDAEVVAEGTWSASLDAMFQPLKA